jgi:hypothetical protein
MQESSCKNGSVFAAITNMLMDDKLILALQQFSVASNRLSETRFPDAGYYENRSRYPQIEVVAIPALLVVLVVLLAILVTSRTCPNFSGHRIFAHAMMTEAPPSSSNPEKPPEASAEAVADPPKV